MGGKHITERIGHYTKAFAQTIVAALEEQFDFERVAEYAMAKDVSGYGNHGVNAAEAISEDVADVDSGEEMEPDDLVGAGAEGYKIPASLRLAVKRLHENTGHRSSLWLARALLVCGAPREAVQAAKELKCEVCAERKMPRPRLPASLTPPRDVGEQAHIDLVVVEDAATQGYYVAHITDSMSRFQVAAVLPDKSSGSVIRFIKTHWLPLLGSPHVLVADQGKEFVSEEFGEWCELTTLAYRRWQNCIAEQSGVGDA